MAATVLRLLLSFGLALGAVACTPQDNESATSIRQTQFPGQVSAGGKTSGQLMKQAGELKDSADPEGTPGIPQGKGGNTGGAAMSGEAKGTSSVEGNEDRESASGQIMSQTGEVEDGADPEGTPGIPQGSGGNTGGVAMSGEAKGTSPVKGNEHRDSEEAVAIPKQASRQSDRSGKPQPEAASEEKIEAKQKAEAKAEREKQELEASMDAVTARWQSRATSNDWQPLSPPRVDTTAGVAGEPGSVPPRLMRSEKQGTAPTSADIKPAPTLGTESGTP